MLDPNDPRLRRADIDVVAIMTSLHARRTDEQPERGLSMTLRVVGMLNRLGYPNWWLERQMGLEPGHVETLRARVRRPRQVVLDETERWLLLAVQCGSKPTPAHLGIPGEDSVAAAHDAITRGFGPPAAFDEMMDPIHGSNIKGAVAHRIVEEHFLAGKKTSQITSYARKIAILHEAAHSDDRIDLIARRHKASCRTIERYLAGVGIGVRSARVDKYATAAIARIDEAQARVIRGESARDAWEWLMDVEGAPTLRLVTAA